jgi:phosphate transport system substrate-binding protein
VSQWIQPVGQAFGYTLVYGPVGSGAGIQSISSRTVDFGASDAPLSPDQASGCHGCVQIPWALSATTLSYNVPGTPNDLHLTGPIIADMFLGKITSWSDPQIKSPNPKASLPDLKVTPAYRADGSGDTYAFTDCARAAYPISTITYVILPTSRPKAVELRKFVFWALTQGRSSDRG